LKTIEAYRSEIDEKKVFVESALRRHPDLVDYVDPIADVHNMAFDEIRVRYADILEDLKMNKAASRI